MRYTVDVAGEIYQVILREGKAGIEVSLGNGNYRPVRLAPSPAPLYTLQVGPRRQRLTVERDRVEPCCFQVSVEGNPPLKVKPTDVRMLAAARGRAASRAHGPKVQRSAMPGLIVEVRVGADSRVEEGEILLVLEAMKMQNEIRAERAGVVKRVHVQAGDSVPAGAKLVEFAADGGDRS